MPAFLLNSLRDFAYMVILIALQVVIFNNINFLGYSNPYIYVLFLILFPINRNKYVYLIYAFILGLAIDFFENTGGVNALASVFVAFMRNLLMQIFFSKSNREEDEHTLSELSTGQWFIYLVVMIFVHHFMVDLFDNFTADNVMLLLKRSAIGGLITFIICALFLRFFPRFTKSEF